MAKAKSNKAIQRMVGLSLNVSFSVIMIWYLNIYDFIIWTMASDYGLWLASSKVRNFVPIDEAGHKPLAIVETVVNQYI